MLKKYGFLFGSLAVLVIGLICLLASGMTYPTLVILLIGVLCTIASMFASLPMPDEQIDNTDEKKNFEKDSCKSKETPVVLPAKKHKIVCKYCKNRFPCTADKCPHCGAPVDIASLTPECLAPIPHEKKIEISTPKTTEKNKKKTAKNK